MSDTPTETTINEQLSLVEKKMRAAQQALESLKAQVAADAALQKRPEKYTLLLRTLAQSSSKAGSNTVSIADAVKVINATTGERTDADARTSKNAEITEKPQAARSPKRQKRIKRRKVAQTTTLEADTNTVGDDAKPVTAVVVDAVQNSGTEITAKPKAAKEVTAQNNASPKITVVEAELETGDKNGMTDPAPSVAPVKPKNATIVEPSPTKTKPTPIAPKVDTNAVALAEARALAEVAEERAVAEKQAKIVAMEKAKSAVKERALKASSDGNDKKLSDPEPSAPAKQDLPPPIDEDILVLRDPLPKS